MFQYKFWSGDAHTGRFAKGVTSPSMAQGARVQQTGFSAPYMTAAKFLPTTAQKIFTTL